ncbi:uncharacterized protein F4817DRAFT_313465 [Daldinia loculata]|uniref:uncharacterized protein n=1 Tax=Daldinia loculata TaxID=103429 RepID=UPI0020C41CF6|nr:uncharacterized protein F4817DRAFT_313465 [Daldinia loculata]KAI1649741.1 hypothetical protein F4817DRAFT_313465 [Daldinia loculata]
MSNPLVCYSLRKRPVWASLAEALLQGGNSTRWKEAKLDTHDVALPLPNPGATPQRILRALLLSPPDVGKIESRTRIQRLFHLNGGQDIAIVFLLQKGQGQESPMTALMTLQLDLVDEFEIPIILVNSVQDVSINLMAFHRQISISNGSRRTANPVQTLLPYCSDGQLLSEHAVNVLTDLTSNFRDFVGAASTQAGQMKMAEFLGSDSQGIASFWANEYLVE